MPLYMTQFKYTPEAWRALTTSPADRSVPLGQLMEKLGGRLLSLHYCLGAYDGVIIFEAPDALVAGAGVLAAFSAGHMSVILTTPLFTTAEGQQMMQQAGQATYQPPTR